MPALGFFRPWREKLNGRKHITPALPFWSKRYEEPINRYAGISRLIDWKIARVADYRWVEKFRRKLIEPGGIVQLRYRGCRVGARITKAAANEFVGQNLSFETSKPKFEDLAQDDFIAFREENIFGYDPPAKR